MKIELYPESPAKKLKTFLDELRPLLEGASLSEIQLQATENSTTWDKIAREKIGTLAKNAAQKAYANRKLDFYLEGEKGDKWRFKPRMAHAGIKDPTLFGSAVFPDAAVFEPVRFAIEIDHSGDGRPGGALKMALAKASANCFTRFWPCCVEIFYNQKPEIMKKEILERKVIRMFEKKPFNTFCIVLRDSG